MYDLCMLHVHLFFRYFNEDSASRAVTAWYGYVLGLYNYAYSRIVLATTDGTYV